MTQPNSARKQSERQSAAYPSRSVRHPKPVPVNYPKGYFTELIFKHNFPPNWQPQPIDRSTAINAKTATANRERAAGEGIGWGDGTTPLPGTPKYLKPAWMVRD